MSIVRLEYFIIISMQVAIVSHFHKSPRHIIHIKNEQPVEKYYEGLGCVKLTKDWSHRLYRPVNVLPVDRHIINTVFLHWTLRNGNCTADVIGSGTAGIKASGIGHTSDLKILIHDFTSNGYTGWIQHLSHALLTSKHHGKMSVVSVNWAVGAEPPYYQAVANARLVALEIVVFLDCLRKKYSLHPENVHMIGHGLGAHTAGYVGKVVRGIRRITALSPSGPYFQNMPSNVKLWRTDANYVEVVHTDCSWGGHGSKELAGHVNFFPNGGLHQPGCERMLHPFSVLSISRNDLKPGQIARGCSHKRAFKYYIESLTLPGCTFIGNICPSYKNYVQGKCASCGYDWENCAILNPFSEPRYNLNGSLYFMTASRAPFCLESFEVTIGIQRPMKSIIREGSGRLSITIAQKEGDVFFTLNECGWWRSLNSGYRHKFIVRRVLPPMTKVPVNYITLNWNRDWCLFSAHELLISNITILKLTENVNTTQIFCGATSTVTLKPNSTESFHPCDVQPPPPPPTVATSTPSSTRNHKSHKEEEDDNGEEW